MEATYCVGSDVDVSRMFDQYLYKVRDMILPPGADRRRPCREFCAVPWPPAPARLISRSKVDGDAKQHNKTVPNAQKETCGNPHVSLSRLRH